MTDLVFVRIHAMPCVNRCWHCFCEGGPGKGFMPVEKCMNILDQLAELKAELGTAVFPMFYDEPTTHPSFTAIMKHQLARELIFDDWWFATNGYGLARMSDGDWRDLAAAGFNHIRLTFHGTGALHDELAGREGAYDDLVKTIALAEKHNVQWLAGMVLNSRNQAMYEETEEAVMKLGSPECGFGWMLPQSQGRASADAHRVRIGEISRLLSERSGWYAEGDFVRKVLSDVSLGSRTVWGSKCRIIYLDIDRDLNVHFGGGCDGDPFGKYREMMFLGNLEQDSMGSCLDKYLNDPPRPVTLLDRVTWRELAERYGNERNDQVFHYTDLTGRKWAEAYLNGSV